MEPHKLIEELGIISNMPRRQMLTEIDSRIQEFEDAIKYCMESEPSLSVRLASPIWRYWLYYGHVERGVSLLESVISGTDNFDEDYCEALLGLGILCLKNGSSDDAEEILSRLVGISLEGDFPRHYSVGKIMISRVNADRGDFRTARELVDEIAVLSAENGDFFTSALAMHAEAYLSRISGDLGGAVEAYERAIVVYRERGVSEMEKEERRNLGTAKFLMGEYKEAAHLLQRDAEDWVSGIPYMDAYANVDKAILAYIEGKYEKSISLTELAVSSIEDCEQSIDPDEWLLIESIKGIAREGLS